MATVYVGSARIDENGNAHGGSAGDQTGKEVGTQKWYKHSKGWRVFRAVKPENAKIIAEVMKWACGENKIGYDQWQRHTLYKELAKNNFTSKTLSKKVETDCSALVRVCLKFCGIDVPEAFRTGNMPSYLLNSGEFVEMKGSKYTDQSTYLGAGDILVTKTNGHTVVVINSGDKYEGVVAPMPYKLGDRILKKGMEGTDVKELQTNLITLKYDLGKYGADGDFGSSTEKTVKAFQKDNGLTADGEFGPKSLEKMNELLKPEVKNSLEVIGNSVNIRRGDSTAGSIIKVAEKGDKIEAALDTNGKPIISAEKWNAVRIDGEIGWICGKYVK